MTKTLGPKMICKSALKDLGFTEKMIKELCPEPDGEATNPMYASAAPMKLWDEKRIKRIMRTKKFAELKLEADKRREACAKANETKRAHTEKLFDDAIARITVCRIDFQIVQENALRAKWEYDLERGNYDSFPFAAPECDRQRWTVNYIRHNLTTYDEDLYKGKGRVGIHEEYTPYKCAVLEAIARVYPEVADACQAQIDRLLRPHIFQ